MKPPPCCAKCGKLTFASRAKAEEAAYRLQHDHGTRLCAYPEHGGWHLTAEDVDAVASRGGLTRDAKRRRR